jgi:hypothetical protein
MSGPATPWTTAVLVILCGGLGAAVALELSGGLSLAPEVTAAAPATPPLDWPPEPLEFEAPSQDGLDDITARPLFSPSRKPFVAAEEAEPAPVAARTLPAVQLIGVLVTEQQRAALMQAEGAVEPSWVREGADIDGWRVEAIEHSRVHLRADDRLETVELRPDTAVPAKSRPKKRKARADERREAANKEAADKQADEPDASDETEADPAEQPNDEDNGQDKDH